MSSGDEVDQADSFDGFSRRAGAKRRSAVASAALVSLLVAPALSAPPEPKAGAPTPSAEPAQAQSSEAAPKTATGEASSDETASPEVAEPEGETSEPESETATPSGEPEETAPEEEGLSPLDPDAQDPRPVPESKAPLPRSRMVELGPLVGMVYRPSGSDAIEYRPGFTFGGYARAELLPWLGVRLSYREERIPVGVQPGGFDYEGQSAGFEFQQPDLEVLTFGLRVEPTWVVTPRFRLFGAFGVSWLRVSAPVPRAEGFVMDGSRAGTEVNFPLGLGASFEVIPDWMSASLTGTYGFVIDRQGRAYEPLQTIVDGRIFYLAPLPGFQSVVDVLFTVGIIL